MQNCKIILKDKYLSSTLTKEVFDSYDDFRKEIEVALFEKNKAIPVKLSFGDKGFQKMKMLKLSRKVFNRSNVTVVEVSAPNPEKGEVIGEIINSENKKIGKYSVIIPDIREGFSSKPDMDTIMSLWLGNYFTPETTEEVQTAMNELREILTKLNAKDLSKESASFIKSLIGDGGIYDQYSTIVGRDAVIDDVVMQLNKKLEDRLIKEPLTGQYRDLLSVSERERVYQDFLQAVDNPPREEGTFLFKSFTPITDQSDTVNVARQILIKGVLDLYNAGFEIRIASQFGNENLAQPLVTNKGESRPLTLSEIRGITNKSVVGTFEILTENGWQPLFLKRGQSLGVNALNNDVLTTTELSEALAVPYSFADNTVIKKESPYLYVTMPNRQVSDNVRDSLEKGEPFFFSLVSGGGGWSGDYVSLDKRGFKLEDIYIETEPLSPLRGRPVLFRNGQTEFLHLGTLKTSDVFFQDIKSLLEHTFDSKEEIVSAINYIESVVGVADFSREGDYLDVESDLSTKVEITARTVQFTPIETTKGFRIQSTVNRISTKEGFIHIPFDNRESEIGWSEKIQAGILAERIHVPKDEENQVTIKGLLRVFVKDNKVQTESVSVENYQSFLLDRIRTRLIKIGDTGVLAERYLWAKENKFPINESKVTPSRQSLPDVVEESQIPTPEKSIKSNKYEKDEEVFFQTVKDENTLPDVSDRDAALQWMSRVMPDAPMEIVEGLIDGIGRGSFDSLKDLITLSRQYADGKTVYHEVFHRAFAMLPDETREKLLDEGSKRFSIERGESKATIKYSAKQQDQINYTLKAVDILNSDKAKQVFDKGVKNNWTLDKILTELAIPKEQKQLILDLQKKEVNSNPIKLGVKELFNENSEFANQVYETLGFKQNKIDLKPYALDVWGKVPNQRGDNKFVDKEQYSVKINTENKGIDVRLTIYFDKDTNTAFVSNIENFENEVTHKDKKGLGKKAFIEANKLIVSRGFTPVIDNLVSGFGYDMLSKLEKEGFLVKNLDKIKGESNYKNIKYKESPFSFTDKIYQDQITPQQKQQALQLYSQYLDTIFPDSKVKDIVYHFSNVKIDKPDKEKFSLSANINRRKGFFGISKNINPGNNFANVEGTIPHAMLFDMKNPDFGDFSIIPPIVAKDDSKDSAIIKQRGDVNYYSVFEPEQIHILGNKSDIEGFKKFTNKNNIFSIEEIITDLLANYSYTVEIKTAKEKLTGKIAAEEGMYVKEENGKYYLVDAAYSTKNEISKQEYEDFNNNKQIPTKHYSDLTVLGGTNYTENEIATPNTQVQQFPKGITVKQGVKELFDSNSELSNIGTQEQYSQYLDTIFPDSKVKDIAYHTTPNKFDKFDKKFIGKGIGNTTEGVGFYFSNNKNSYNDYKSIVNIQNVKNERHKPDENLNNNLKDVEDKLEQYLKDKNIKFSFDFKTKEYIDSSELPIEAFKDYDTYKKISDEYFNLKDSIAQKNISQFLNEDGISDEDHVLENIEDLSANFLRVLLDIKKPFYFKTMQSLKDNSTLKDYDSTILDTGLFDIQYVVFEPEQIHILGSKQDIEGFKKWKKDNTKTVIKSGIVPSIKGHAQFATDNGIGWFRSDEKIVKGTDWYEGQGEDDWGLNVGTNTPTKTRRILELQSDLFQKGRDKEDLIKNSNIGRASNTLLNPSNYSSIEEFDNAEEDELNKIRNEVGNLNLSYEDAIRYINTPRISTENQFLQLLNKDNNWVTFFIKSIVQDSAKKGYEKVLFPSGNTASKIEGHTTLEEFKTFKEKQIIELGYKYQRDLDVAKYNNNKEQIKTIQEKWDNDIEINQLKQELERVETEGFGALRPIWNFYENTVQNILNKQFGKESVTRIADEYGNEWFEISLDSPKVLEQTSNIKFQAPNIEYTGDLAIEEKMAELSEEVLGKGYVAKNWFEKILQDIWNWIQDLVNPKGEIEKLFRNINQGRIKGKVKIGSKKYQQKEPYKKLSKPIVQHLDMLAAFELWQHDSFAKFLNDEIKTDVLIKEVKSLLLKENLSIKDPALKEEIDNLIENWEDIYPLWIEQSSLFDFSEITENEDEENTGFQERTEQKLSSLEQADRWARAFIHTIPSIEMKDNKPVRNSDGSYKLKRDFNGLLVPANYTTLWNVIADIAEGSLTVDEIVQKLEQGYPKIHEIYIVKDRLNQLFPYTEQGRRVRNLTDALLLKSLEKSFAKVLVPTVILKGKSDENGQIDYQVIQSDRIDSVVISNYITSLFRQYARTHDLVLPEGFVDHKKLLEDLNRRFGTSFEKEAIIKFWEELGIFLPETSIRQHGVGVAAMTAFTKSLVKKLIPLQQIESDELKMDFDLFDFLNRDHNINGVISSSESYTAKRVRTRLAEILPFATSNMTKNAEGENQSNLHNFSTWLLNIKFLNEGAFDRIGRASNPMFKRSKIVNLLKQGKKIEPVNLSGTTVEYDEVKGQNSINLDAIDYVRQEMHTMYLFGSIENIRAETASSSFGYRIEWDDKRYTPLPNYNSRGWAKERFIEYLKGELERIWSETNRPSAYTSRFYNTNKGEFSLFKDIFPNEYQGKKPKEFILNQLAKVESVDRVEDLFTPEFKQSVEKYLDLFFDKSVNDFKQWMFEESGRPLTKNHPVFHSKNLQDLIVDFKGSDNLIENFILNSLIFKVEEIIVFHGELALFDKFFKRSKSPISNGTSFIVSNSLLPVVASYTGKPFTFSEAFGVKPNYLTDTKNIKSIVLKEDEIGFRGNIEDWTTSLKESVQKTLNFFNKEVSQDTIDEQVKKIISGYDKSVVSDGEGFVHPDAYRLFLIGVNSWTKDMETGYLYLAAKYRQSKGVDIGNQIKFIEQVEERIKKEGVFFQFPKLKFQYRGHATSENNTNIAVELLDKFALTPLFPDMVEGSLIGETLLSQMSKQSIAYGKFESGTKLMSFPPDGISGLLEQVKNGDVIFTSKHTIDSVFLKEQVKTPHKVKTESIFGSQSRKLILSNLSLEGNFMPEVQDGVDKWINGQREVAAIERKKILKELGASENIIQDIIPEGQETQAKNALENVTIDLSKLIDMVKKEADKRDLPESVRYVIDNFDTLSETHLETSLSPQNINTLIYSILKNRIVKVKYPGAQFVQVASSLFSKGERDLNFYRPIVKDGKTIILPADCKISMSGDFLNLLNLKEVGDGTIFEKTKQLNELLKDETFREKHQEVLTVFAYRIPTQGFNSMDILMVKEFLPPYTANTIIPPPEITVKSGADYDYDKMVVVTPSIDRSGKFIKKGNEKGETVRLEILYDKLFREFSLNARILMSDEMQRALALFGDDTVEIQSSLIRDGQLIEKEEFIKEGLEKFAKKAAYNDAITGARAILLNPVNFHRLVTPNDTEIIKAELNKILQPLYDTTGKVNVEPSHTSIVNPVISYKKWSAVKIKDLLGIGAVANTFYTLMQVANVKTNESLIINKVPFYFNLPLLSLEQQEKVNLSDPFVLTKDGSVIDKLEYINQFINLTVDAASDDIAGYSNMILDNTGYIMFMVMLGHPFETVLQLIHQPIIYRYHQIVRTHKSLGKSPNDAQKEALQELLDISSVSVNQYGIFPKSNEKIWKEIRDSFSYHNEIKLKNIQPLSSHRSIKDFSVRDKEVLTYYLIGLKEAEALRELQSFNNFDTSTSPSYKMSTLSRSTKNIKGTGLFDLSDAIKIHTESVISHLDVHDLFGLLSTQAFPILNSQPFAKKVVALAGDVYGDVEKFIRVMDNDFLLFIVQNFGDYAEKREKIEDLLSKGKLMSQWTELTNKYPSLKDFYLYKKLIEVPSKNSDFIHPSFFMGMDNQAEDFNQIIKELRQLLNSSKEDVRMFAENLIEVGFYQSGYNSSKLYMLKGFPPEYVYKMTKPAFDKFFNLSRLEEQEYVNIFEIMFLENRVFEFGKFFSSQYKDMGTSVDAVKVGFSRAWYDLPQYLISSSQKETIQDKKEYAESLKNKETEYTEFEEVSNKADTIYSQLGDKTQSENVVIKPWSELEDTKEAVVNNQKNIKYTYQDFANDNKGIKVLVQYDKYEKPFEALITGEVEEVGSGNDENGNYKYVGVQVKSNTGKLLTVNPFFEITGNVKNQDKLTNESNVIRETESISSKENPIIVYVDGSDIKGTGNIGFGVNTTQNNKEYSISGAFDTNDLSLLEKDLGVKLETKPSNAVMEFYGSLVALRNTPKNEFITIKQDLEGVQLWILSGLMEKLSKQNLDSKKKYDIWYKSLSEEQKQEYYNRIQNLIGLDKSLISKFDWDGRKGFYAEDKTIRAIQQQIINLILERKGKIQYQWVKGHSGEIGNEKVDVIAKDRNGYNTYKELFTLNNQQPQIVSTRIQGSNEHFGNPFDSNKPVENKNVKFEEEQTTGYRNRTIKNASADATIAIAVDFNSAGEKLTKSSVLGQSKKYISLDANNLTVTQERVDKIVEQLNSVNAKTLNIAGNGIYTMKGKYTQQQVDDFTYELLNKVLNSPNLKTKIESIRSGGQTGFDEAGTKAGIRLGLPTLTLAPKGWTFRNSNGQDISNEQQFKARFENLNQSLKPIVAYRTRGNNFLEALEKDNAIGNPWNSRGYGLYKTNTVKEAVQEFISWMTGEKHTDKLQDYRRAIIDRIPEMKGKSIIYYKELGEPSHATALDWLIQNWEKIEGKTLEKYTDIPSNSNNLDFEYHKNVLRIPYSFKEKFDLNSLDDKAYNTLIDKLKKLLIGKSITISTAPSSNNTVNEIIPERYNNSDYRSFLEIKNVLTVLKSKIQFSEYSGTVMSEMRFADYFPTIEFLDKNNHIQQISPLDAFKMKENSILREAFSLFLDLTPTFEESGTQNINRSNTNVKITNVEDFFNLERLTKRIRPDDFRDIDFYKELFNEDVKKLNSGYKEKNDDSLNLIYYQNTLTSILDYLRYKDKKVKIKFQSSDVTLYGTIISTDVNMLSSGIFYYRTSTGKISSASFNEIIDFEKSDIYDLYDFVLTDPNDLNRDLPFNNPNLNKVSTPPYLEDRDVDDCQSGSVGAIIPF